MNVQGTKSEKTNFNQMPTFTATEARNNFSDVFNQAHFGGGALVQNRGRKVAVIPLELLERLAELEAVFDQMDAQEALAEFRKQGGVSLDQLEKELNDE